MLEPIAQRSVEAVVARLSAVQAAAAFGAELSINTRRLGSRYGDVADGVSDGRLIKTFAFRGAVHLMNPEDAGTYLAIRAASRKWELPSWQSFYDLKPSDWPSFRATVREALANGPLTRQDLGRAVTAHPRYRHLGFVFEGDNWTLLKPLAWLGDICFAGPIGGRTAFQRLDANPRWRGIPDLDEAGPRAIEAYVAGYGPATMDHINHWLGEGLGAGRKRIRSWLGEVDHRLAEVDVDGESAWVLREHVDDLLATRDGSTVRLLPGSDQWVMGTGTADSHVTPLQQRSVVTKGANLVICGGVVSGTWAMRGNRVSVGWFGAGAVPTAEISDEVTRLGTIVGEELELELE